MSAESASSSAGGGLLELLGVELGGALGGQLRGAGLGVLADDLDGCVVVVVGGERDVLLVDLFFLFLVVLVEGGAGRSQTGELGLLEVGLAPTGSGQDGFDELLIKWVHRLPPGAGGAAWVVGEPQVCGG